MIGSRKHVQSPQLLCTFCTYAKSIAGLSADTTTVKNDAIKMPSIEVSYDVEACKVIRGVLERKGAETFVRVV
jgi:hypothetical protein